MTKAEIDQAASDAYDSAIIVQEAMTLRSDTLREKYNVMLGKVEAWKPPSVDHVRFKQFMIEQIATSIDFDCGYCYNNVHEKLTGEEWLAQEEAKLRKDITYYEAENAKEIEQIEGSNRWIKELRDNLNKEN